MALTLVLGPAPALAGPAAAATTCRPGAVATPPRVGGVARIHSSCPSARSLLTTAATYGGNAPLVHHSTGSSGGAVMGTRSISGPPQITLTPIFWAPAGYSWGSQPAYVGTVRQYLADITVASGTAGNVFSTTTQYGGPSGRVAYNFRLAPTVYDTAAFPASGCDLDAGAVYSDASGYDRCLDDDQVQAEITSVVADRHLPTGLGQLYLMFLPKGVESCFVPGSPIEQACTINPSPSSAYCGYHGVTSGGAIYANLPFPIHSSPVPNSSCTDETLGAGGVQAPSGNPDADVVLSTTSHEMAEAMTDPFLDAWYTDPDNSENGDLCAYDYGTVSGPDGGLYNQTVNGHHYLTQTEFSNAVYFAGGYACVRAEPILRGPHLAALAPSAGSTSAGHVVTLAGSGFTGASRVLFGSSPARFTVMSDSRIIAITPAHGQGAVNVVVTTGAGSSVRPYLFLERPRVTRVAPVGGSHLGGTTVTITGSNFHRVVAVRFGYTAAAFTVNSATRITVRTPAHSSGSVNVLVYTPGGTSAVTTADRYRFT